MADPEIKDGIDNDALQQIIQQALGGGDQSPAVKVPYANPPLPAPDASNLPASSRMTSPSMAAPAVAPPDDDRPSLGSRIGAKPNSAQPIAPPSSASNTSQPPELKMDPSALPSGILGPDANKMPPSPPVGGNNPNLVSLLGQQAKFGTPLDRNAVDPTTGKPKYKMGIGGRLAGIAANFASGMAGKGPVSYIGPGATNHKFDIDNQTREANLANVGTQIQGQEKLDSTNTKAFEDLTKQAYEGQLGQARLETAKAAEEKAVVQQQLAAANDVKVANAAKFNEEKTNTALAKLDEQARRNDQLLALGKGNQDLKQMIADQANQLRQQKLDDDREKFNKGTDAKSLEAERKYRLAGIENDYKIHYIKNMFNNKDAEIKGVNDDINQRLAAAGVNGAPSPGGTPPPPAKGFTRIKASDGSMHDIPSARIADAKQRDPKLTVVQ